MAHVQERYLPVVVAANSTVQISGSQLGGFLCTAGGTLTVVRDDGQGNTTTLINALAVTAGVYYPLPFYIGTNGGTATTASSGAGLLGVA